MEIINIMSSEGRDYLAKTIKSIYNDNQIYISYQGQDKIEYYNTNYIDKPYQELQLNAQYHYSQVLKNAKHNEKYVIIAEDDIQFSKNFNLYLDLIKLGIKDFKNYIIALYSCYDWQYKFLSLINYPIDDFYATQCMIYDIETAENLSKHIQDNLGKEPYDLAIKTYCKNTNTHLLATTYSLVEHIGEVSTGLGNGHKATRFIDNHIK